MITTVTLNASIDKAYYMDLAIENGQVMRVSSCRNSAGGKGLNVARIIKLCQEDVLATGLVGGYNGNYLESLLNQDGINYDFEHVQGETRSCINILDPQYGSTEYLEPGCLIDSIEEKRFIERFKGLVEKSKIVTISGSVPKGVSKTIYQQLVTYVKEQGKQVLLDTSGELLKIGLKAKPTMVKPNQDELEMLFNTKINDLNDVIIYAKKIYEMGIENVVVSLGGDGALLVCQEGIFQGKPPQITVVNTVGCGDSMVGAFAVALKRDYSKQEALKYAVAIASANAMSSSTGDFEPEQCKQLLKEIKIKQL